MTEPTANRKQTAPSLAEVYDWGAQRTWLVFLGLAVGHGFVAGAIAPIARTLPLFVFRLADPDIVEFVTIFAVVALMLGWWILMNRFCRSLHLPEALSSSPEAMAALRLWRRSWFGWLLVVMWVLFALPVAHGVEFVGLSLIYGNFDGGITYVPIMSIPVLLMGLSTQPGFMDRWGQKKVARTA